MREALIKAFPSLAKKELSDDYIESHPDPMWDVPPIPLIQAVPLYMLWCIEHRSDEGKLVFEYTIGALNKYARARDPSLEWQNFRFSCTAEQVCSVKLFLQWCQANLAQDYEPALTRAIKNWEAIS